MQDSLKQSTVGASWSLLHPLRILLRLPFLLLHIVIGLPLIYLTFNRFGHAVIIRDRTLDEIMQVWWSRTFCSIFGIRRLINGQLAKGPLFVVANHISFLDIVLLSSIAKMSFVSKAEIENWPLVGTIAKMADTVFHHRGSGDSLQAVVDAISEKMIDDRRVAIFPEGRIYCGDNVHRFHARLFQVPIEHQADVQPICIRYTRNGRLNPRICLCDRDERFFWNLLRLLGEAGSSAELHVQALIPSQDKSRRELAETAQIAVASVYFDKEC